MRRARVIGSESNVIDLYRYREIQPDICRKYRNHLHVTKNLISRLGLEKDLEGHTGCVNCIEWNETGTILASGSDDVQVILWDPFRYRQLHAIQTGHNGNIFSVKFLPNSGDRTLVSGAGDCRIRIHNIDKDETTLVCSCHAQRVKRLGTAPNVPYMFWSASEDGTVLQFDLRTQHICSSESNDVLINLTTHMGRYAEAKCLAVNQLRPELIAVGANDPYVRLYDRRMIRPTCMRSPAEQASSQPAQLWELSSKPQLLDSCEDENMPPGCVHYFVPGHLRLKRRNRKRYRNLAATYLTFAPNGNELLVNMGGEQIYLFDINRQRQSITLDLKSLDLGNSMTCPPTNGYANGLHSASSGLNGVNSTNGLINVTPSCSRDPPPVSLCNIGPKKTVLPPEVEQLRLEANKSFEKRQYTTAISLYNQALAIYPAAVLYGNRAAAYMKRDWDGDVYAALRDCYSALQIDPNHLKAHFRLARCLFELKWTAEASEYLHLFKCRFPDHASTPACKALDKDIQQASATKQSDNSQTDSPDINEFFPLIGPYPSPSVDDIAPSQPEAGDGSEEERSGASFSTSTPHPLSPQRMSFSPQEQLWCEQAFDYEARFCGHCNTTTDIKEANFFGSHGQFIVAGSDDGSFFIWDRHTTNILQVLHGDDSIVNCLQPHPFTCLLATSGIDSVVRLWSPRPEDGTVNDHIVPDLDDAASANQKRMNSDPFEVMLMNMGYRIRGVQQDDEPDERQRGVAAVQCNTS